MNTPDAFILNRSSTPQNRGHGNWLYQGFVGEIVLSLAIDFGWKLPGFKYGMEFSIKNGEPLNRVGLTLESTYGFRSNTSDFVVVDQLDLEIALTRKFLSPDAATREAEVVDSIELVATVQRLAKRVDSFEREVATLKARTPKTELLNR